jgi:hypothetical protein
MAWKLPRRGGGFDTSGFDTSGGEQLWQAKTVGQYDPGLYKKGWFGGTSPTKTQKETNKLVERYRRTPDYFDPSQMGFDDKLFRQLYPNMPKDFNYGYMDEQNKWISDIPQQERLEEPEDYFDRLETARGGIASLENRPRYKWGGESGSYDIEKAPWQPLDSGYYGKSDWQYSGNRDPKGHMMGTWRQTDYGDPTDAPIREKTTFKTAAMDPDYFNYMNPYYDDEIARRQNARRADIAAGTSYGDDEFGGSPRFTPAAPIDPGMWGTAGKTYGTTPDEVREGWGMEGSSETPLSTRLNRLRRGPWMTGASGAIKKLFSGWQEGGAVGLEPGIGSLMGYAKGGMVTKVKVPKGQSKWMKRFMNNMRDS